jgi:outer membrane biosynthesis protein TonB
MPTKRAEIEMCSRRIVLIASLLASGIMLGGCSTFDPTEWFNTKKPLPGDRKEMFPGGVPGVAQGVPPELVKGYQPPPETPPPVVAAKPEKSKPKPKKAVAVQRKPRPQPQVQQQQQMQQAPAAQTTTTQPAGQSAGGTQTMPGAQPTWPTNAPPAPGPWAGPQR